MIWQKQVFKKVSFVLHLTIKKVNYITSRSLSKGVSNVSDNDVLVFTIQDTLLALLFNIHPQVYEDLTSWNLFVFTVQSKDRLSKRMSALKRALGLRSVFIYSVCFHFTRQQ